MAAARLPEKRNSPPIAHLNDVQTLFMKNQSPSRSDQAKISARDVASVIFRHKLLICATFLLVAVGSGVMTFLMPNEYESRMKILVKNTRSDVPITPERTTGSTSAPFINEVSENQVNSKLNCLPAKTC